MLPAVYHLDDENHASGSAKVAVMAHNSGFHIGTPPEGKLAALTDATFVYLQCTQVYTNLFPARHTWYLLGTIIILNGIDWAGFELLSIGNKDIESLPTKYRVLDGLFQALGMPTQNPQNECR